MKKALSLLLVALLTLACASPVFAEEAPADSDTFSIINYNVDGLPIPKAFSPPGKERDPWEDSAKSSKMIREMNLDIVAVQEDFNCHQTVKRGIKAEYTTFHNGGIPWGDGLNFYSKFPLYNVHREAWKDAYGIFTDASDELTPKGFLCSSFKLAEGVYLDVYDVHADANSGGGNMLAKLSQYEQLLSYVNKYSKGHATILTGDFNSYFSEVENQLYEKFIEREGFKEAWIECNYEGNYDTTYKNPVPEYHKPEWNYGAKWGIWDSAEKMFYRDGEGITLEAVSNEYRRLQDENGHSFSDHSSQIGVFKYTVDRSALNDTRTYKKPVWNPVYLFFHHIYYFFKCLYLMSTQLPAIIKGDLKVVIDK